MGLVMGVVGFFEQKVLKDKEEMKDLKDLLISWKKQNRINRTGSRGSRRM